jgi:Tfp pilus assembly protein FimT
MVVVGLIAVTAVITLFSLGSWRADTAFAEMMDNLRADLRTLRTKAIMLQANVGLVIINIKAADLAGNAVYAALDPSKNVKFGSNDYFKLSRTTDGKVSDQPQPLTASGAVVSTPGADRRLFLFVNKDKYSKIEVNSVEAAPAQEVWFNPQGYATKAPPSTEKLTYSIRVTPDPAFSKMNALSITINPLGVISK